MSAETSAPSHVRLLWTGGWDSTFQLLRLLLTHRVQVEPFFPADRSRPSTDIEIRTTERIRTRLLAQHPQTRGLLLPTRFFALPEPLPGADTGHGFRCTLRKGSIEASYAQLARFCQQHGIGDMELCIHYGDRIHAAIERLVVETVSPAGYRSWRIDPRHRERREYALLEPFSFPLFHRSKLQMARIANKHGWNDIMYMTWFCQQPQKGQPCGRCRACRDTTRQGLGWRIPLENRVNSSFYRTLVRPLRTPAEAIIRRLGPSAYIRIRPEREEVSATGAASAPPATSAPPAAQSNSTLRRRRHA